MGLFREMSLTKEQILCWSLCQVKITDHHIARSGALLHQGKLEHLDLLCHQSQDVPEPWARCK